MSFADAQQTEAALQRVATGVDAGFTISLGLVEAMVRKGAISLADAAAIIDAGVILLPLEVQMQIEPAIRKILQDYQAPIRRSHLGGGWGNPVGQTDLQDTPAP